MTHRAPWEWGQKAASSHPPQPLLQTPACLSSLPWSPRPPMAKLLLARVSSHAPRLTGHEHPGFTQDSFLQVWVPETWAANPQRHGLGGQSPWPEETSTSIWGPPRLVFPQTSGPFLPGEQRTEPVPGREGDRAARVPEGKRRSKDQNQVFLFIVWKVHLLVSSHSPV